MTAADAIARARAKLGLNPSVGGSAWVVRRLDRPDADYFLVVFGNAKASVGVATVHAKNGVVLSWATLPGTTLHMVIDEPMAIALAGLGKGSHAELVWKPCRASKSPLYPVWRVQAGASTCIVDQAGSVADECVLDEGLPG